MAFREYVHRFGFDKILSKSKRSTKKNQNTKQKNKHKVLKHKHPSLFWQLLLEQ